MHNNHLQIKNLFATIEQRLKSIDNDVSMLELSKDQKLVFFKMLIISIIDNVKQQCPQIYQQIKIFMGYMYSSSLDNTEN